MTVSSVTFVEEYSRSTPVSRFGCGTVLVSRYIRFDCPRGDPLFQLFVLLLPRALRVDFLPFSRNYIVVGSCSHFFYLLWTVDWPKSLVSQVLDDAFILGKNIERQYSTRCLYGVIHSDLWAFWPWHTSIFQAQERKVAEEEAGRIFYDLRLPIFPTSNFAPNAYRFEGSESFAPVTLL